MSRIVDFVVLGIILFTLGVLQFVGGAALDPLREALLATGSMSNVNGESAMDGMFSAVTYWVPLVGQIGAILIVAFREYRRQVFAQRVAQQGGRQL